MSRCVIIYYHLIRESIWLSVVIGSFPALSLFHPVTSAENYRRGPRRPIPHLPNFQSIYYRLYQPEPSSLRHTEFCRQIVQRTFLLELFELVIFVNRLRHPKFQFFRVFRN